MLSVAPSALFLLPGVCRGGGGEQIFILYEVSWKCVQVAWEELKKHEKQQARGRISRAAKSLGLKV